MTANIDEAEPADQITIETPRLLLRAAVSSDAEDLNHVFSDPETVKYWSEPPHPDLARSEAWVESMTNSIQNGRTDFVLCLKPGTSLLGEPRVIGKLGIYGGWPSNEIGYIVGRQHWRQGFAREALCALLAHLFSLKRCAEDPTSPPTDQAAIEDEMYCMLSQEERQSPWLYQAISADVDPRNVANMGLLRHFGFVLKGFQEKTFKIEDVWSDSMYMRLDRNIWARSVSEDIDPSTQASREGSARA